MVTITIPKKEYQKLLKKAFLYEYVRQVLEGDIFLPPPIKDISQIVKEFKTSKKYNKKFIADIERGLKRSSYFK